MTGASELASTVEVRSYTGAFESTSAAEVRSRRDGTTEELRNQADGHP
jgi:hypothetical protein